MSGWADQSTDIDQLASALIEAQSDMKDITRNKVANTGQYSYSYADLADVLAMSRDALAKHGLAITQIAEADSEMVSVWTTLLHRSGQYVCARPTRLPAGKTPQHYGSAISYARRYALMAVLNLAAEDDDAGSVSAAIGGKSLKGKGSAVRSHPGSSESRSGDTRQEVRSLISRLDPDDQKDLRSAFVLQFGCGLSDLPEKQLADALAWVQQYVDTVSVDAPTE